MKTNSGKLYWTCPQCGTNLDYGEECDCAKKKKETWKQFVNENRLLPYQEALLETMLKTREILLRQSQPSDMQAALNMLRTLTTICQQIEVDAAPAIEVSLRVLDNELIEFKKIFRNNCKVGLYGDLHTNQERYDF